MKKQLTMIVPFLLISAATTAADELEIRYRSGKTQRVTLDEKVTNIDSWQFITERSKDRGKECPSESRLLEPPPPRSEKSGVKVIWDAKPLPE